MSEVKQSGILNVSVGRFSGSPESNNLELLARIPEEEIWLASLKTENTRRAYRRDVCNFLNMMNIKKSESLQRIDHRAVMYWEKHMREVEHLQPSTIRRRLAALSSLFSHLVKFANTEINPVREITRPHVDRSEGKTLAFSPQEARKILDAPSRNTVQGLRDRSILSIGFQAGLRREEIAALKVDSLHRNRGFDALWVRRKRKRDRQSVTINQQTANRIRAYFEAVQVSGFSDRPMFRPVQTNGFSSQRDSTDHLHPDTINRILKKYVILTLGNANGYSAHSMRTTFATTALENHAAIEEVQYALGHSDISTTKLYDRRRHNPEKSAAYFANY